MTATRPLALAALLATTTAACLSPITRNPENHHRDYTSGSYAQHDPSSRPSAGSLFSDAVAGYLEDTRAVRVGDVVVINIDENADARGTATTNLSRDSTFSAGINGLLGLVPAIQHAYPGLDPARILDVASHSTFAGAGDTQRGGQLSGNIAVRVVREMPNGDMYVEGTKTIQINNEQYHLYVSGLVRPSDIAPDNSVASSRVADAQFEFTGHGDVSAQSHRGWLMQLLDLINPF